MPIRERIEMKKRIEKIKQSSLVIIRKIKEYYTYMQIFILSMLFRFISLHLLNVIGKDLSNFNIGF